MQGLRVVEDMAGEQTETEALLCGMWTRKLYDQWDWGSWRHAIAGV